MASQKRGGLTTGLSRSPSQNSRLAGVVQHVERHEGGSKWCALYLPARLDRYLLVLMAVVPRVLDPMIQSMVKKSQPAAELHALVVQKCAIFVPLSSSSTASFRAPRPFFGQHGEIRKPMQPTEASGGCR